MFDYHTLDIVADAFNPAIGLLSLAMVARPAIDRRWRASGARAFGFGAMMLVVYALLFVDRQWEPRLSLGVGYSTHAAFAIASTIFNAAHLRRLAVASVGLQVLYLGLIAVQGYHGVAELLVTSVLVAPPCIAAALQSVRLERRSLSGSRATGAPP